MAVIRNNIFIMTNLSQIEKLIRDAQKKLEESNKKKKRD